MCSVATSRGAARTTETRCSTCSRDIRRPLDSSRSSWRGGSSRTIHRKPSYGARGPEEILDRAAARMGASGLSERTREYVLAQLRDAWPQPEVVAERAVGLLLGSPELQRR